MRLKLLLQIIFLAQSLNYGEGKNIFFYGGVSGISHRISVWPLVEKLADKGHNVTFFSPFPPKVPNHKVHEIIPENFLQKMGLTVDFLGARLEAGAPAISKIWNGYIDFSINSCEVVMQDAKLVEWIKSSSYDLVFVNGFFNDCGLALSHYFKAPHIIFGTVTYLGWWSESYGFADENLPELQYHLPSNMNFFERAFNLLRPLHWHYNRLNKVFPRIEAAVSKGLNLTDLPPLHEIERNVAFIFVNAHHTTDYPRSTPPLIVEVGGIHLTETTRPLSKDLMDFIDAGKKGFIYFSFGTFAKPETLPVIYKDMFFESMRTFKDIQFIVKWNEETHPKIHAFISHGGLLGNQEAVYHGVPLILIPLFGDQDFNADRTSEQGRGIVLEIMTMTQRKLEDAIMEITTNPKYKANAKHTSKLFRDKKSKPLEDAIWWTDYVLRHGGNTAHLKPVGMSRTWYERRQLDVWSFFLFMVMATLLMLTGLVGGLLYMISRMLAMVRTQPEKKVANKKKK
ncbi:UDP-glucuronosyltransferase 1-8 [Folsomia candida]|uniref:UDP-glucuronosyltransferase 1-8 n=1 Tax=Folsomia candida TaxID=158441 RepID=A0A226EHF1_FOLCA|nr:UDP-glucuronosyltransferase 1-8 [Folsomia candida]